MTANEKNIEPFSSDNKSLYKYEKNEQAKIPPEQ